MIDQFQQRKRAEELTNGMALGNAALEQLDHKIKEEKNPILFSDSPRIRFSENPISENPILGKVLPMLKYQCCRAEQHIEISVSIFSE